MNATRHQDRGFVDKTVSRAALPSHAVEFPDVPAIVAGGTTRSKTFTDAWVACDLLLESSLKPGTPEHFSTPARFARRADLKRISFRRRGTSRNHPR